MKYGECLQYLKVHQWDRNYIFLNFLDMFYIFPFQKVDKTLYWNASLYQHSSNYVAILSILLFFFSPIFGICNLVIGIGVFQILSWRLDKQFKSQYAFKEKQRTNDPVSNAEKVRTRVISGEIGSLLSSTGVIILLGVLIFLFANGDITPAKAFVLFIALRMVGQLYSGLSSGLMRFARARVFSG